MLFTVVMSKEVFKFELTRTEEILYKHVSVVPTSLNSYSTDQEKPNRERLTERVLQPFHMRSRSHSVSVRYLFRTRSISVPYPIHIRLELFPFCQCSIGKCSGNSFRRTRFPRTRLQECFQGISNTQFKFSPYVCVHEYKQ